MKITEYYKENDKEHWIKEIRKSDWRAASYLCDLLEENRLKEQYGEDIRLLLLTEGDRLLSFCTYGSKDEIDDDTMRPWIGFVYTFPEERGKRRFGELLKYIRHLAETDGYSTIFISTEEEGLYERYGFVFRGMMKNIYGDDSRIYALPVPLPANPWEAIALSDYEGHMSLREVGQLQTLNLIMKEQFEDNSGSESVMVLGVAGGNGLEHIRDKRFKKVYGIDINSDYLMTAKKRFADLSDILDLRRIDLINEADELPPADLVIADLLIEYIGYAAFGRVLSAVSPKRVSCVIQINGSGKEWVSKSPYLHAFDDLETVHVQMEEDRLTKYLETEGFVLTGRKVFDLPNGKRFIRTDYGRH